MQTGGVPPTVALLQKLTAVWISQSISVVAKLGTADALVDGEKGLTILAADVGQTIIGSDRDDNLLGGVGPDRIDAGAGHDVLWGTLSDSGAGAVAERFGPDVASDALQDVLDTAAKLAR